VKGRGRSAEVGETTSRGSDSHGAAACLEAAADHGGTPQRHGKPAWKPPPAGAGGVEVTLLVNKVFCSRHPGHRPERPQPCFAPGVPRLAEKTSSTYGGRPTGPNRRCGKYCYRAHWARAAEATIARNLLSV